MIEKTTCTVSQKGRLEYGGNWFNALRLYRSTST